MAIGVFAVPTLLGNSLHWVPGFSHGLDCCGTDYDHAACHDCPAQHDAVGGVDGSQVLADDGAGRACAADQCPICSFLHSGKAVAAVGTVQVSAVVAAAAPALDRVWVPARQLRPLGPRRPPLG